MDVQKNNFLEALEVFRESIGQCSAVALDLEFSGVRGRPELYIDSIEDRYSGLRRVASTYKIIQVGLCTFTRLENS
jgi:mRNA deadenylase subunit